MLRVHAIIWPCRKRKIHKKCMLLICSWMIYTVKRRNLYFLFVLYFLCIFFWFVIWFRLLFLKWKSNGNISRMLGGNIIMPFYSKNNEYEYECKFRYVFKFLHRWFLYANLKTWMNRPLLNFLFMLKGIKKITNFDSSSASWRLPFF